MFCTTQYGDILEHHFNTITYPGIVVGATQYPVNFFLTQAAHCCIHIAGLIVQYLKIKGMCVCKRARVQE